MNQKAAMRSIDVRGKDMTLQIVLPVSDIAEWCAAYVVAEQARTDLPS